MNKIDEFSKKQYSQLESSLKNILLNLTVRNNPIIPAGSAFNRNMKYYGDYDLVSFIETKNYKLNDIYNDFKKIFKYIESSSNLFFVEFKIQKKNGDKQKYFLIKDVTQKSFNMYFGDDIDFCKLDMLLWSFNRFIEVSIIYYFDTENISLFKNESDDERKKNILVQRLKKDADEYAKEGNYFKAFKRQYSIAQLTKNLQLQQDIQKILNSKLGELYQIKSKYEAMDIANKTFGESPMIKKMIKLELHELGDKTDIKGISSKISEISNYINQNAKNAYKSIFG